MPKLRLLAVDDDETNLRLISACLADHPDYAVVTVESGQDVISRLQQGDQFDALLVDWMMPAMSGYDLITQVRANPRFKDIRIMMITAKTELDEVRQTLEAGAREYLMKPFTKEMLINKLELLFLD